MPKIPTLANPNKSLAEVDAEKRKLAALNKANPQPSTDEIAKQEVQERAASRKKKKAEPERPILYPLPSSILCIGDGSTEGTKSAVTNKKMKELLNYETEDQWRARIQKEKNDVVEVSALCTAGFGDDFLFKNLSGQKVRCWNNTKNRPFNLPHAKEIAQEILRSGPGLPKEKRRWQWNGESFIMGDRAQVISGQHRGIGLTWACDEWKKDPDKWKDIWPTEPTLDTLLVFGVPEVPYVLRTIDNVMPRKLSDVFYTSTVFTGMNNRERDECSRSLANALDLLWVRTGAGVDIKYQTHGESVECLDRHPRLLACVKHLYDEDKDRAISTLKLSPGKCAALMYLFATSKSDRAKYEADKREKSLDFSMWEKAREFFLTVGNAANPTLGAVRGVIGELFDADNDTLGGRVIEKHAVLCKAWNLFCDDTKVSEQAIRLSYGTDANGNIKLLEKPTVGGIDLGEATSEPKEDAKQPAPSEADVAKAKAEVDKQRIADMDAKIKAANKKK